jgi:hypothetical protein
MARGTPGHPARQPGYHHSQALKPTAGTAQRTRSAADLSSVKDRG